MPDYSGLDSWLQVSADQLSQLIASLRRWHERKLNRFNNAGTASAITRCPTPAKNKKAT
ncbi:hypothetical protein M5M_11605 [Simiduia agarivorans SA1 = DSM 21679]|uniref:Uncharacterized protein n=1 Tax=Simiduia agarivorans (strain DSM 21679 / JCM 13881 / BCRC 17597 / SA1) TaxID=1117647 RepID=K4KN18_SIMAS|nr:hypothetical protein M5M_11605 [Simiduia agarivorans SA1 = DSM 21679]